MHKINTISVLLVVHIMCDELDVGCKSHFGFSINPYDLNTTLK